MKSDHDEAVAILPADDAALSETVSEKPQRGRPRKIYIDQFMRGQYPELLTERSFANRHYESRAWGIIDDVEDPKVRTELEWLVPNHEAIARGGTKSQSTILSELGRIEDDETLLWAALSICRTEPKLTARQFVHWLRRQRRGKIPKTDTMALTLRLARVIDDYQDAHPGATKQFLVVALENVIDAVNAPNDEADGSA